MNTVPDSSDSLRGTATSPETLSSQTGRKCRWGILGPGHIAHKNWQSIRDAGNSTLVAVASRSVDRSEQFVAECQAQVPFPQRPIALGSYEELIGRNDIDAVYLAMPTGVRKEWALRAAAAGKHLLIEKPVGVTPKDVEEMIAACERHQVQFMDGVMFMHGQRLAHLRQVLDAREAIGDLRHISSQFSFSAGDDFLETNIRTNAALEPLGCLGDLGWYCIRFSLWAMNYQEPIRVSGRIHSSYQVEKGGGSVPIEFTGTLEFEGGASASFFCSFLAGHSQFATLTGTKGYLRVPDFVLPFVGDEATYHVTRSEFQVDCCRFDMKEGRVEQRVPQPSNNQPDSQESNMFRTFSQLVLSGKIDSSYPRITLQTQRVLQACLS